MNSSSPNSSLAGLRVLVTGAGQGLGQAIAQLLLERGAAVALHYRSSRAGAEATLAAVPGASGIALGADLTDPVAANRLVAEAVAALGGLDVLVNNAGDLIGRRRLEEMDDPFWRKVFDVNVATMIHVSRAALPALREAGATRGGAAIVNLSSLAGRKGGHPGSLAYSAAKGAVLTFTRALANELGPVGIRVNAVAPGLILGTHFHDTHTTPESARATIAGLPLGRAGTPADVARAVAYLASETQGFMTGGCLDLNGGAWAG